MADRSFGEWLKHHRKASGWTQKELALQVNCSISTIRKMESEERRPSAQVVTRLAEIFGIPEKERRTFLRFARGDWQAAREGEVGDAPVQGIPFALPNLANPRVNWIGDGEVDGFLSLHENPEINSEKIMLIERALKMAESVGDIHNELQSLWQLGWLDQAKRFSYWEKALGLTRRLGDAQALASGLSTVGFFLVLNGDLIAAQNYLSESSALYQQLQLRPVASHLLSAYGQISLIRGDFRKARAYLREHARTSLELGNRQDYLWSYVRLGYVALCEENWEEAHSILEECASEFKKDRNTIGVVFALEGLAALFAQQGSLLHSARLLGWADSTREKISDKRPLLEQADIDKVTEACLARLGKAAFSEVYRDGQKMTMNEAVLFARRSEKHAKRQPRRGA